MYGFQIIPANSKNISFSEIAYFPSINISNDAKQNQKGSIPFLMLNIAQVTTIFVILMLHQHNIQNRIQNWE